MQKNNRPQIDLKELKKEVQAITVDIDTMGLAELALYSIKAYDISYAHGLEVSNKIRQMGTPAC
jgi:hypothetical protein